MFSNLKPLQIPNIVPAIISSLCYLFNYNYQKYQNTIELKNHIHLCAEPSAACMYEFDLPYNKLRLGMQTTVHEAQSILLDFTALYPNIVGHVWCFAFFKFGLTHIERRGRSHISRPVNPPSPSPNLRMPLRLSNEIWTIAWWWRWKRAGGGMWWRRRRRKKSGCWYKHRFARESLRALSHRVSSVIIEYGAARARTQCVMG